MTQPDRHGDEPLRLSTFWDRLLDGTTDEDGSETDFEPVVRFLHGGALRAMPSARILFWTPEEVPARMSPPLAGHVAFAPASASRPDHRRGGVGKIRIEWLAAAILLLALSGWSLFREFQPRSREIGTVPARFPAIGSPAATPSGDVPTYLGDAARTGVMPGPAPHGVPEIRWTTGFGVPETDGRQRFTVPVIVNGTGYLTFDDTLWRVDLATGSTTLIAKTCGSIRSTPTVVQGVAFLQCGTVGSQAAVQAIQLATGDVLWSAPVAGNSYAAPVVSGGVVYAVAGNTIVALDAGTGGQRWLFTTSSTELERSAPALADGALYVASWNHLVYCLDAETGVERWRFDLGHPIAANVLVLGDVVVVVSRFEGQDFSPDSAHITAIDRETGTERWRTEFRPSNPQGWSLINQIVSDGRHTLFLSDLDPGRISAYSAIDGSERWSVAGRPLHSSNIVYADGLVFVPTEAGVQALDAESGVERWWVPIPRSLGITSVGAVSERVIYVSVRNGLMALADPPDSELFDP